MYDFLKKKGLAIGLSAALVTSLGIGSVSYYNSNNQSTNVEEVEEVEIDTTAPVITINNNVIHTSNLDSVILTDYVTVEDDAETTVSLDNFVKLSDPTIYNDETKRGFIDQLSTSVDAALIEESQAKIAEAEAAATEAAEATDAEEATVEETATDIAEESTTEEATAEESNGLADGIYQATVIAEDATNNVSAVSILLVYDSTGPDISHDTATETQVVADPTQAPTVTVSDEQIVDAFDGPIAADAATVEVAEADAENHIYTVNITASDALGNATTITYNITLEQEQVATSSSSGSSGSKSSGKSGSGKSSTGKSSSGSSGSGSGSGSGTVASEQASTTQTGVYKYCPTSINGSVLYCSNEYTPGEVKDGIYLNGTRVLTTTSGAWDSVQVCDPTVICGSFSYQGTGYTYLMAYLGCATYDCTANEVGFAVSNDLYNWKKVGRAVAATRDGYWGVGQPSLINKDGNIFLFYTSGTASATTTYAKQLLDSNFDNGIQLSDRVRITCSYDFISNADFAFSGSTLYMTCDTHPFPSGSLNFISAVQSVYQGEWDGTLNGLGSISWSRIAQIGSGTTGHERNHNGCFVRSGDGSLASRAIYVSTADSVGDWMANLCTYRFQWVGF